MRCQRRIGGMGLTVQDGVMWVVRLKMFQFFPRDCNTTISASHTAVGEGGEEGNGKKTNGGNTQQCVTGTSF